MAKWTLISKEPQPFDTGILVSDGEIVTVARFVDSLGWMGHGWSGYEWDFDTEDFTHWMPLPDSPEDQRVRSIQLG